MTTSPGTPAQTESCSSSPQTMPPHDIGSEAATTAEQTHPCAASQQSHICLPRQHIRSLYVQGPHLLQHSPFLGQKYQSRKRRKNILETNRASPSLTLMVFAPYVGCEPTLDPPSVVLTATEQKGSPTSHAVLALPLHLQPHPLPR